MSRIRKLNQIKVSVIISYLNTGLNMLIQLIYTPMMIRILGQSEYGLYTLVGSFVSYLSLFSLGFTGSYLRFYSRYAAKDDKEGIKRLNGLFLVLFCCMALIAMITGLTLSMFPTSIFGKNLTAVELIKAQKLMQILVINIALTFPSSVFESIISSKEQFIWLKALNLACTSIQPCFCLPLLLLGHGSIAIVIVTTILTLVKLTFNSLYCVKKLKIGFSFGLIDKYLIKEIGTFSFFIFLNMLIDQINVSIDKYVLGRVKGTIAVAVYGIGANINAIYISLSTAVSSVFAPRINMIAMQNDNNKQKRNLEFSAIFIKVGRVQYYIISLIILGVVFWGKFFITNIYATSEYGDSYYVALLIMIPETVPLIENIGLEILNSLNYHYYRSIAYFLMSIANIFISIPLATRFGPVGAAFGTTLSIVAVPGFFMNYFYSRKVGIDIIGFWKNIANVSKGLIIPILLGVLMTRYVKLNGLMSFCVCVVAYTLIHLSSLYIFGANEYEKNLVKTIVKKIFRSSR